MRKDFKPNQLKKLWLKLTDTQEHKAYKRYRSHYKLTAKHQKFIDAGLDTTVEEIIESAAGDEQINLLHTGNAGDIIYVLPVIKKLHELAAKPINLVLKLNEPLTIGNGYEHPLGSVMLNQGMAEGLIHLLNNQSYINEAVIFNSQKIHLDLTLMRKAGFPLDKGNIARWSFFTTGINPDMSKAWLTAKPDVAFADKIVLARSSRYNNVLINYNFLSKYDNLIFVGVKSEYEEMKKSIPNLKWHQVDNFLQLAQVIAGCKLFIGNQSFPYSIAEGLKVNRLLEVFYQIPNVMAEGPGGHEFCFQKHFEWLVSSLES